MLYEYTVEYGTPQVIASDGIKWVHHSTVTGTVQQRVLQGARADAQLLRDYHVKVRIMRDGERVS